MAFQFGYYAWQTLLNGMADSAQQYNSQLASGDAAANAQGRALYAINGEATLWGKVIPISWGTRRITGQLLQIGIQKQETKRTPYRINPNFGDVIHSGPDMWQSNVGYKTETSFVSTFAYVFGAPGNRTATQILKKVWFNGQLVYDIDKGFLSNEVRFKFYQGDENQLPDLALNEARYTHPIAYRGLMYIVFYEYTIYGTQATGNPVVEAEFAEQLTNNNTSTDYSMMGQTFNTTVFYNCFDSRKGISYTVGTDGYIYKYRVSDRRFIDRVKVTGTLPPGSSFGSGIHCFVRVDGVPYILYTNLSGSNSRANILINADTGAIVDSLGANSGSLTPSLTNTTSPQTLKPVIVQSENGEAAYIASIDIFGYTYLFKVSNGELSIVKVGSQRTANSDALAIPTSGEPEVVRAQSSTLYRDDVAWFTMPYNVCNGLFHCTFDDTVIVFSESSTDHDVWSIQKITNEAVPVVKWQLNYTDYPNAGLSLPLSNKNWKSNSNTAGGQRIGWSGGNNRLMILDMISGELTVMVPSTTTVSTGNGMYDAYTNRWIRPTATSGVTGLADFPFLNQTSSNMLLSTFLRNIAELQGYETANITVENIPDQIIGAVITEKTDIDAMLEDIRRTYNFTIIKSGRFIKFTRRNYDSSFVVDAEYGSDKLAVLSDSKDEVITVNTEISTPLASAGTIRLRYIDPDYQYTVNEFTHKRNDPLYDTSVEMSLRLPIIMTGSEAAALAARALVDSNMNDTTHRFRLPQRYLAHEPGDTITLNFPTYSDTVRVVEISYNADFSLSIKSEAILTQDGPAYPIYDPIIPAPPPDLLQGAGQPLIFDTTLIRYTDQVQRDAMEIYIGAIPAERLPLGGSNLISHQVGDASMTPVDLIPGILSYGTALTQLNSGPVLQVLYEETLQFRVAHGNGLDFTTDTVLNMLAGKNRLLVGDTGRWEQIGFIEASFDSVTGIVTLTGLCRGLRGTEVYAGTHVSGDYVVLIDTNTMLKVVEEMTGFEQLALYAVSDSLGRANIADAEAVPLMGMSRRPWAPYNVHVVNSSGDLVITWNRRTRLNGPLNNGNSTVPLDETDEKYQLVLYRAGIAVRTVELTSPTFTYTSAMQTTDGWAETIAQLQLDVTQVSSLVGPGFIKTGTYDVE